jgi:hypothetical protein
MINQVYKAVEERAGGRCEVCGRHRCLTRHHILGGRGRRKECERPETVILVCDRCHGHSTGEHEKQLHMYRCMLQSWYFKQGHTEEKVRELMGGKLYLIDGDIAKGLRCLWMEKGE